MAKQKEEKAEPSKSELIREALKSHPNATAKEIVEHVKAKGVETNEGLVYQVKRTLDGNTDGPKKAKKAKSNGKPASDMVSMAAVQKVKALISEYGTEQVETIVKALK
jgi:hypothetical protein